MPAATPVTVPVAETVAFVVSELVHVPPLTDSVNVAGVPIQMVDEPVIVPDVGGLLTVNVLVAVSAPHEFDTM